MGYGIKSNHSNVSADNNSICIGDYSKGKQTDVSIGYYAGQGSTVADSKNINIGHQAFRTVGGGGAGAQRSIHIGYRTGEYSRGAYNCIVGWGAGGGDMVENSMNNSHYIDSNCTAIGTKALARPKSGASHSITAVGRGSGESNAGDYGSFLGYNSGYGNAGSYAVAVGVECGKNTGTHTIAIGNNALWGSSSNSTGNYAIGIGYRAGYTGLHANSIILNASGSALNSDGTSRFYVKPIRSVTNSNKLLYNSSTGEITYQADSGGGGTLDTNTSVFSQKAQTTQDPALSNYGIGGYYRTGDIVIDPEGDSITGSWNGSAWAPDTNTQITMHGHMVCLSHIVAGGPGKFGAGRSRDDSASGGLKDRAGATIVIDFPQLHPNPGSNKPDPYMRFSHGEDYSVGNIYSTTNQSHWMWRTDHCGIYLAGGTVQVWSASTGLTNILTGSGGYSDDRLKFNETDVTEARAQEVLRAVPICEYMKVSELMTPEEEAAFEAGSDGFASRRTDEEKGDYPASYWEPKREVGTIAQRLTGTAAEFIITPGTETESYKVKYDQLTCINTRVLQGLLDKVETQNNRIMQLENENTIIKNALNSLLPSNGQI